MFHRNEGTLDRDIRIALAVVFGLLTLFTPIGVWQILTAGLAGIMLLTAAVGVCPIYAAFGINTCKVDPPARH
jgi:Protein of unknown function (DUF2892)